jgi:hypothetical protein
MDLEKAYELLSVVCILSKVFLSETRRKFWIDKYLCDKYPVREQF